MWCKTTWTRLQHCATGLLGYFAVPDFPLFAHVRALTGRTDTVLARWLHLSEVVATLFGNGDVGEPCILLDKPEVLLPAKGSDAPNVSMLKDVLRDGIEASLRSCPQCPVSNHATKICELMHSMAEVAIKSNCNNPTASFRFTGDR